MYSPRVVIVEWGLAGGGVVVMVMLSFLEMVLVNFSTWGSFSALFVGWGAGLSFGVMVLSSSLLLTEWFSSYSFSLSSDLFSSSSVEGVFAAVGIVRKVPATSTQESHKHHHHGGAFCPSYGVGSMDTPDRTWVTSSEGVGQGHG